MLVSSNLQANSFAMQGCSCCLANVCLPFTLEFRSKVFLAMDYIDNLDDIFGTQEDVTCTATTDTEMDGDKHHSGLHLLAKFVYGTTAWKKNLDGRARIVGFRNR